MAPTRREFLRKVGFAGAGIALSACGSGGSSGSGDDGGTPPADFDFPVITPLPFAHGVASGDPLADRVIIWTRVTHFSDAATVAVNWEVATDPLMHTVIKRGSQDVLAAHDWTVKIDVTGLSAAMTYYYRFSAFGKDSITGRTRTAPAAMVSELRFAVLACSSYWSSWLSGLGHIADRNDLDLVIHCGDYIYDFVDEDEQVRARKDLADTAYVDYRDWFDLSEVRRRYALWRSDPNLLRAHQQHPWFIVWDNHDIDEDYGNELTTPFDGMSGTTTLGDVCRAFHEWTPTRPVRADGSGEFVLVDDGSYPVPPDVKRVYRKLPYGPLADVFGVDTQINMPGHGLDVDSSHLESGDSLFGRQQFEWLGEQMLASQQAGTTWRLLNNQTWIAPADVPPLVEGVPPLLSIGVSRWSTYTKERAALCRYLRGDNPAGTRIRNNVFVSGDVHGNFGADVIENGALLSGYVSGLPLPNLRAGSRPANLFAGYTRLGTGNLPGVNLRAESVAVEFAPSSMGRGGADELIANATGGPELTNVAAARLLELALITLNKNVQFLEWVDHGYGIVQLSAERAVFEYWWQDKLTPDAPDVLGMQMVSWAQADESRLPPRQQDQIDSVTLHGMTIEPTAGSRIAAPAPEGVLLPA